MTSNLITISAGQCGIGLGLEWWRGLCEEHGIGPDGVAKELETRGLDNKDVFFYQADNGRYVARAIVADLEPRVIERIDKSEFGVLFNPENIYQSDHGGGAGNVWFSGFEQGGEARESFLDIVQREAENAETLEGFIMSHSVSGGTGSGFGSNILESLRDSFPKKLVETYSVFPSVHMNQNDVVLSPYNAVLTLRYLQEFSDAVIVVDNIALHRLAVNKMVATILTASTAPIRFYTSTYNKMADHIAELASFDPMHFIQPGYTPFQLPNKKSKIIKTSAQEVISKLLKPTSMMVTTTPSESRKSAQHHLLSGLAIIQGHIADVNIDDIILKMHERQKFTYPPWSGVRLGTAISVSSPYVKRDNKVSGLLLANHTSIANMFDQITTQCESLLRKKLHFHHFKDYDDAESNLKSSFGKVRQLIDMYDSATRQDFLMSGS
ncbi:Tubulin gamma-1 chain-like protein [Aphelenchoides bicaudatus]|nr:Tubulin gamma-1 chain-like protein [Aphelenchoides bicaudatus]